MLVMVSQESDRVNQGVWLEAVLQEAFPGPSGVSQKSRC